MSLKPGAIRLGCIRCYREDFDGVDVLPDDWEDIEEVQSLEDSLREIDPDDPDEDVTFWETHMGVCRDCQKEDAAHSAELEAENHV
jgi:hypothetical protein